MNQVEKYECTLRLLKELNCPDAILEAIQVWGMFVHQDDIKLHNWQALSQAGVVEGECREVGDTTQQ